MLNKYFRLQFFFSFFLSALPFAVFAQEQTLGEILNCGGAPCKLSSIYSIIAALNSYLAFYLMPSIATIAFIYAGMVMIIGVGNPGEVKRGREIINNTLYGIVMVFAAYYIVDLIVAGLAGGTGGTADTKATQFLGGNK